MVASRKTVKVTSESNIVRLLDDAKNEPVLLEREGIVYRLSRTDEIEDIWAGYDPERVRAGLKAMAGIISVEEGERLKELVYRGREEGTRPAERS
ncbi:MAG: hypothetical protein ACRDJW_16095 [Thermomicrobiales bacterium]